MAGCKNKRQTNGPTIKKATTYDISKPNVKTGLIRTESWSAKETGELNECLYQGAMSCSCWLMFNEPKLVLVDVVYEPATVLASHPSPSLFSPHPNSLFKSLRPVRLDRSENWRACLRVMPLEIDEVTPEHWRLGQWLFATPQLVSIV